MNINKMQQIGKEHYTVKQISSIFTFWDAVFIRFLRTFILYFSSQLDDRDE